MPAPAIHLLRKHRPSGQGASVGVERERLVPVRQNENRVRGETLDDIQKAVVCWGPQGTFFSLALLELYYGPRKRSEIGAVM